MSLIDLINYRYYLTLTCSPAPRLNVVMGANAQGKTNLLEALGFLLTGRSFRTFRLGEIPRWGSASASLSGELRRAEGASAVRRAIARDEAGAWRTSGAVCPWARVIAFGW